MKRTTGGGEVGRQVTTRFKINAYDPDTHVLWGTGANGMTKSITVQDPRAREKLKALSPR